MLRFWKTDFFQRVVRPLAPNIVRDIGRKVLLSKAKLATIPPSAKTISYIFDNVRDDAKILQQLAGRAEPLWDLDAARDKHLDKAQRASVGTTG